MSSVGAGSLVSLAMFIVCLPFRLRCRMVHWRRRMPHPTTLRNRGRAWRGALLGPDDVDRELHRRNSSSVLEPVSGIPILGPAHSRPIVGGRALPVVSDRALQYVDDPRSILVVVHRTESGSRLESEEAHSELAPRHASISGPRSTVASSSAVRPLLSGTASSLLMVRS